MIAPALTAPPQSPQELLTLQQTFERFIRETETMRMAYADLQSRVAAVNLELEQTNRALHDKVHELNLTQHFLNGLLESVGTGVIAVNAEGRIETFNGAAERILDRAASDFQGNHYRTAFAPFPALRAVADWIHRSFTTGRSYASESANVRTRAQTLIPLELTVSRIKDARTGEDMGAVLTFQDLRTIQALETRIRKSETLAAIGEMAATIAHEIRNPLGGIEGFSTLLARDLRARPDTMPQFQIASNILDGVQSLKRFVSSLLTFSRPIEPQQDEQPLRPVFDRVLGLARARLQQNPESRVKLLCTLSPQLPDPSIDGDLIGQALLNLLINSLEAVDPRRGRVSLTAAPNRGRRGRWIRIRVRDNGPGIPEEMKSRLFHPFQTTKPQGTGLGLAVVYKIVQAHHGTIRLEPSRGRGTVFCIDIPCTPPAQTSGRGTEPLAKEGPNHDA